jgi:hypothetical protein
MKNLNRSRIVMGGGRTTTFSKMTFSITTLSIMTPSKMGLLATLSINDTEHNATLYNSLDDCYVVLLC